MVGGEPTRRLVVLLALAASAFAFNTTENLPIGLLPLVATDLGVSVPAGGLLVGGYGLTVAVASLPLAYLTRDVPRRYLLTGVLALLGAASAVTVVTSSYPVLVGARVATALAQAVFWAVAVPVAVGLFRTGVRGRVVAAVSVGGSLATVLGVPAGTWLGERAGWRIPFLVLTVLAVLVTALVAALLPTSAPQHGHGTRSTSPHPLRYAAVLLTTAVSVTGMFAGFTYVAQFLTEAAGFPAGTVGALLFVFGAAGLVGVTLVGRFVDRFPGTCLTATVAGQAGTMVGLWAFAPVRPVVVGLLALLGATAVPVFLVTQARILHVAPGRTEVGFAANSATFNLGVAAGSLLGGVALPAWGPRATFLAGGLLTGVALVTSLGDALAPSRSAPQPTTP
ncbi:MFS transporter [Micromonospora sp. SH-82]|uniref:MFS transporter n=1 Tax=Micromonospora sp. SH-82 TaxID=3132938 RepID=UPI003EB79A82